MKNRNDRRKWKFSGLPGLNRIRAVCFGLLTLLACGPAGFSHAQEATKKSVTRGGMTFEWEMKDGRLHGKLDAPHTGWVVVGFNLQNNIVGSNLLMFRVKNGKVEARDLRTVAMGDPRTDESLGGSNDITNVSGREENGHTYINFEYPLHSGDKHDYPLTSGEKTWVILAWSVSDDWDHHSRMRQHVELKL